MKEIEALKVIFDKKSEEIHAQRDKWVVNESNRNATFRELEINCEGEEFQIIGNPFYKGIKNTTEDRSNNLYDSDCDGVCAIEINGEKHYVFVDLKSNFDLRKINDAYLQDLHTFLKMHTLLSLCEDYSLEGKVTIDLIVACKTFKDQAQEDRVMDILFQKTSLEEASFEKNILNTLIQAGNPLKCQLKDLIFQPEDLTCIQTLPFHQTIKNAHVRIHLILSEKYEDARGTYSL